MLVVLELVVLELVVDLKRGIPRATRTLKPRFSIPEAKQLEPLHVLLCS